jgi:hypothetical protein
MEQAYNGVPAGLLSGVNWCKSSRSNPSGNCVELARLRGDAGIAVRNSRDPQGPVLVYTALEMAAFMQAVREGEFDYLLA